MGTVVVGPRSLPVVSPASQEGPGGLRILERRASCKRREVVTPVRVKSSSQQPGRLEREDVLRRWGAGG